MLDLSKHYRIFILLRVAACPQNKSADVFKKFSKFQSTEKLTNFRKCYFHFVFPRKSNFGINWPSSAWRRDWILVRERNDLALSKFWSFRNKKWQISKWKKQVSSERIRENLQVLCTYLLLQICKPFLKKKTVNTLVSTYFTKRSFLWYFL